MVREAQFRIRETGAIWQTFEGVSGHRPAVVTRLLPLFQRFAERADHSPLRMFGTSQFIVATCLK